MIEFSKYLRKNYSFSEEEAEITLSYFDELILRKNDFFLREGEICNSLMFILKGAVIYFENINGEEKICDFAFEEDWAITSGG